MSDRDEYQVFAHPIINSVTFSAGPFSLHLKADEAHALIDALQAGLRDLAEKEARRD